MKGFSNFESHRLIALIGALSAKKALDSGAVPGPPEALEPPAPPRFDVPIGEEPPVRDTLPAIPV